jgi:5-methyltetrahydropteroyltriglutamate--homocysteine methyltransferase
MERKDSSMSLNTDHIRVTHAGSLPRTPELIAANAAREEYPADVEGYNELLTASVVDLVQRQQSLGIDIPNDGEYGHAMSAAVDYGAWWSYSFARMGGPGTGQRRQVGCRAEGINPGQRPADRLHPPP